MTKPSPGPIRPDLLTRRTPLERLADAPPPKTAAVPDTEPMPEGEPK